MRTRGPSPVVTWLSDQGRVELSALTFSNAVNKASNFLIDGLDLDENDSISVNLGNHWQAPVWFGAGLATGIKVTNSSGSMNFGFIKAAQTWQDSPEKFVVVSQDPFGQPDKEIPTGFINGSLEVRNFGDNFAPSWPQNSQAIVLQSENQEFTWTQLLAKGNQVAKQYGIATGQSYGLCGIGDLVTNMSLQLVLPISNNNSVVLIEEINPDLNAITEQEKIGRVIQLD